MKYIEGRMEAESQLFLNYLWEKKVWKERKKKLD